MGRKIWQRGKAGEKALRASARKMRENMKRMPPEKVEAALRSYFSNRPPEQVALLRRLMGKRAARKGLGEKS